MTNLVSHLYTALSGPKTNLAALKKHEEAISTKSRHNVKPNEWVFMSNLASANLVNYLNGKLESSDLKDEIALNALTILSTGIAKGLKCEGVIDLEKAVATGTLGVTKEIQKGEDNANMEIVEAFARLTKAAAIQMPYNKMVYKLKAKVESINQTMDQYVEAIPYLDCGDTIIETGQAIDYAMSLAAGADIPADACSDIMNHMLKHISGKTNGKMMDAATEIFIHGLPHLEEKERNEKHLELIKILATPDSKADSLIAKVLASEIKDDKQMKNLVENVFASDFYNSLSTKDNGLKHSDRYNFEEKLAPCLYETVYKNKITSMKIGKSYSEGSMSIDSHGVRVGFTTARHGPSSAGFMSNFPAEYPTRKSQILINLQEKLKHKPA